MAVGGMAAKVLARSGVDTHSIQGPIIGNGNDILAALERGELHAVESSMPAIDLQSPFAKSAYIYYLPGWQRPVIMFEFLINLERWNALPQVTRTQVEAVCGDNIRHGLAESGAIQFNAMKQMKARDIRIRDWPAPILEDLKRQWAEVVDIESAADASFRKAWSSLSEFRRDYAIWRELGHP